MERSDDYMMKITMDAFENHVVIDANVTMERVGSKIKAYCTDTGTYLQFPRDIRKMGKKFKADVIKAKNTSGSVFYRYYKGSIREIIEGKEYPLLQ